MKFEKSQKISNLLKFLILFVVFSFLLGVVFSFTIKIDKISIVENQNFVYKFLNIFTLNFWIIFLIWLIGKYKGLFLFDFCFVFLKCFMQGIIFIINIKCNNLLSYFKYFIIDLLVYLPLLVFILYQIVRYNFDDKNKKINYDLLIIIYSVWCIIYASLCSIIGSNL